MRGPPAASLISNPDCHYRKDFSNSRRHFANVCPSTDIPASNSKLKIHLKCRVNLFSRLRQVRKHPALHFHGALAADIIHLLPTGKRIALPTRVEPKVFFANERTFLSWLNFTVILGALAIGMLNFGDRPAFISAFLFTGVAMATMVYALVTYHWRAKSIRMRGQAGFDDRFGPTFLAIILLLAVVVNFVLRITYTSQQP